MVELPRERGVMLDADQVPLKYCGFPDCRAYSYKEPLTLVIHESRIFAVCPNCFRTRISKAVTSGVSA
jgi:hypothetical protein